MTDFTDDDDHIDVDPIGFIEIREVFGSWYVTDVSLDEIEVAIHSKISGIVHRNFAAFLKDLKWETWVMSGGLSFSVHSELADVTKTAGVGELVGLIDDQAERQTAANILRNLANSMDPPT